MARLKHGEAIALEHKRGGIVRLNVMIEDKARPKVFSVDVRAGTNLLEAMAALPVSVRLAMHEKFGKWVTEIDGLKERKGWGWQFYITEGLPYVATEKGVAFLGLENIRVDRPLEVKWKYENYTEDLKVDDVLGSSPAAGDGTIAWSVGGRALKCKGGVLLPNNKETFSQYNVFIGEQFPPQFHDERPAARARTPFPDRAFSSNGGSRVAIQRKDSPSQVQNVQTGNASTPSSQTFVTLRNTAAAVKIAETTFYRAGFEIRQTVRDGLTLRGPIFVSFVVNRIVMPIRERASSIRERAMERLSRAWKRVEIVLANIRSRLKTFREKVTVRIMKLQKNILLVISSVRSKVSNLVKRIAVKLRDIKYFVANPMKVLTNQAARLWTRLRSRFSLPGIIARRMAGWFYNFSRNVWVEFGRMCLETSLFLRDRASLNLLVPACLLLLILIGATIRALRA